MFLKHIKANGLLLLLLLLLLRRIHTTSIQIHVLNIWKWFKKKANGIFKLMLWLAALILIKMYVNSFKLHSLFSITKIGYFSKWMSWWIWWCCRMMNCLLKHELWWWVEWLIWGYQEHYLHTFSIYILYIDDTWCRAGCSRFDFSKILGTIHLLRNKKTVLNSWKFYRSNLNPPPTLHNKWTTT